MNYTATKRLLTDMVHSSINLMHMMLEECA